MKYERLLYLYMTGTLLVAAAAALIVDGPAVALSGLLALQMAPARLLSDFTIIATPGAAVLNAALVAGLGLALVRINNIRLSGPSIAAIFTILGFGLFGKTIANAVPIIIGVWLSARWAGKRFGDYIIIALFGTALGPVVSAVLAELSFTVAIAVPAAAAAGLVTGFALPPIAIAMLRFHQGYSLYNIGLTSGFIALFAAALIAEFGITLGGLAAWNSASHPLLVWLMPAISGAAIALGVGVDRGALPAKLGILYRLPGRLPSDFMDMASVGSGLVNIGILGLAASALVWAVGAPFNGPVVGGIATVLGFGGFGKHLRNTVPPVLGVLAAIFVAGLDPASPGPILALLFVTTLAPIAGEFGVVAGVAAGFVHLTLVMRTGAWHNGLSLYNNGFTGGLVATLFVAVIEWHRSNRDTFGARRRFGNQGPPTFTKKESRG